MRKILFFGILAGMLSINVQAQLLKKLKEKAEKAIENTTGANSTKKTETEEQADTKTSRKSEPDTLPSYCTKVFTLEADETFYYDETSIIARNNAVSYQFVIYNKNTGYFLIDNGKRTGPFKQSPLASLRRNDDEDGGSSSNDPDAISMGGDQRDPVALQYSKTIGGKLYLVFNGKNYGPYDYVNKMLVSPDKKQFFAIVVIGGSNSMMASMGMGQHYIVNEKVLKQKVGDETGIAIKFATNTSFSQAYCILMNKNGQSGEIVTTTGKQLETTLMDVSNSRKNIMISDKGDIISIPSQSPTQILVNGDEAARFSVPIKSIDRLFLMPDVSKSVYYENGKLYKADGTVASTKGILFPRVLNVNGEMFIFFLKMYQIPGGEKNVYLCKKPL